MKSEAGKETVDARSASFRDLFASEEDSEPSFDPKSDNNDDDAAARLAALQRRKSLGQPRRPPHKIRKAYQRLPRKSFVNFCLCFYKKERNYKAACLVISSILLISGTVRIVMNMMALALEPASRDSLLLFVIAVIDPYAALGAAESFESHEGRSMMSGGKSEDSGMRFNGGHTAYLVVILFLKFGLEIIPAILTLTAAILQHHRLLVWYMMMVYVDLVWNLLLGSLVFGFLTFVSPMNITEDGFGKFAYAFACVISWLGVIFHTISLHFTQGLRRQLRELSLLVVPVTPSVVIPPAPNVSFVNEPENEEIRETNEN